MLNKPAAAVITVTVYSILTCMIRRSSVLAGLVCPPDRLRCISRISEGWPWTNPPCSAQVPRLWESSTTSSLCGSRKQIQGFLQALENRAPYPSANSYKLFPSQCVSRQYFTWNWKQTSCSPAGKAPDRHAILGSPGPTLYLVSWWVKHPQHPSPIWLQLNSSTAFFTFGGGGGWFETGFPCSF